MKITEAIDSAAFKHALFEGKVEFDYGKADGTVRHAIGTMNEALLPKVEPSAAFKCTKIEWDVDDASVKLPKCATIRIPFSEYTDMDDEEVEERIGDELVKITGFCVKSFMYEPIAKDKPKKSFPAGSVFYYDLDKKGYRSFKLANLKGWKSC